jgi:hypothetical protein
MWGSQIRYDFYWAPFDQVQKLLHTPEQENFENTWEQTTPKPFHVINSYNTAFNVEINSVFHNIHSFTGAYSPRWTFDLPFRGFSDHTHNYTHGRTPLDEWSARRRGLYLHRITQYINTTDKHPCPERDSNPRPQQPSGRRPTT